MTKILSTDPRNVARRLARQAKIEVKAPSTALTIIEGMGVVSHDEIKERGITTQIIIDMMSREGGCTRQEILFALKEKFPKKDNSVLKNTIGALMHTLPKRLGWKVNKVSIDPKDKRVMQFTIEKIAA